MKAIFKREWRAYFTSPLGFVFIAAYFLFTGYFFFRYNLYGNSNDMRALFGTLFTVTLFLVPILTMRLMSEDRKSKTDQILFMAPVSTAAIVLGKLFAAVCVYATALSGTLLAAVTLAVFAKPDWPVILGHFAGLLLLGTALIAIGLLISALTENQIIAAVGGFSVGFFLILLDTFAPLVPNAFWAKVVRQTSFQTRYETFTMGIFSLADVLFFCSITALFAFFTMCAFEKRRVG